MREKLAEPMRLGDVMAEYLIELEAACNDNQPAVTDGGFSYANEVES